MIDSDGLVGDVLFWSLSRCVGVIVYTDVVHTAWVKIMSRMLRTMVPLAVAHELKDGSAQTKRLIAAELENVRALNVRQEISLMS